MKRKVIICFLILALTSLTCVSGENVTVSDSNHSDNHTYCFSDLQTSIDSCNGELNLTHDYAYSKSDEIGVDLYRNITINGNGHVIDGRNSSMIFNILSSSVVLRNITLINSPVAINAISSNLTTNNIVFINNTARDWDGSAVCTLGSNYRSVNDMFIDNRAEYGSAICVEYDSILDMTNATFKSSFELDWGLIVARYSQVKIRDTTFSNITSRYSSILYGENVKGSIRNSRFIDLHADKTAGAIALKGVEKSFTINNCSFINVTSRKNGGALYFDLISEEMSEFDLEEGIDSTVYLKNSRFINCSSKFGGAYIHLNGNLNMKNCNFTNNLGYAGYSSYADCKISNCIFEGNPEGSLYFDSGHLKISKTVFKNSSKAFIQDSRYTISSSIFDNTSLYSFFDEKKCSLKNTSFISSKPILNKKNNAEVIYNDLSKVETLKGKTLPADTAKRKQFDLRDYGLVSSVKDQGNAGSCWVFAAVSAFESALLRMGVEMDISENSVYNAALQYSPVGLEYLFEGGEVLYATQYFLCWLDLVSEAEDDYDELGRISGFPVSGDYPRYSADTVKFTYDIKDIKKALVNYGALYVPIYMESFLYMNMSNYAYYNAEHDEQNHAVNIVGWDDTFSRSNFKTAPPKDGAWIVKNSWGDDWGDDGYFYVSYYDLSLYSFDILGFKINPETYEKIYQHDYIGNYFENEASYYRDDVYEIAYAQTYTSRGDDLISAVGTYFEFKSEYTVKILINNEVVYTQKGKSKHQGFEIIKLDRQVSVNKNDKFTVEITRWEMAHSFLSRAKYDTKDSYYKVGGKKYAVTDEIPVVKAYVISNPIKSGNLVKHFTKSKVKYEISNIKAKKITVKVDGRKYSLKVKNGKAALKLRLKIGKHSVTTYCKGKKIANQIIIKTSIISKRTIKIHQNTKRTVKVKFVDENGKILKNEPITFKFNAKTFVLKTDKKGIFRIPMPPQLKKGNYYLSFKNPKTKEKAKVTVKIV